MERVLTSCLSLALTSMYCRAMLKAVVGDTISANWGRAMEATAHKMDRRLFQRREEDVVNIIYLLMCFERNYGSIIYCCKSLVGINQQSSC